MQTHLTHPDDRESIRLFSHAYGSSWQTQAWISAQRHFERALRYGWVNRLIDTFRSRSPALLCLADLQAPPPPGAARFLGLQIVPLASILGSEGRSHDFDRHFAPLHEHIRERWVGLATLRSAGQPLPPVELVQVGQSYYVIDGHHRISIARAFDDETIDAHVTRWPDEIFREGCRQR